MKLSLNGSGGGLEVSRHRNPTQNINPTGSGLAIFVELVSVGFLSSSYGFSLPI